MRRARSLEGRLRITAQSHVEPACVKASFHCVSYPQSTAESDCQIGVWLWAIWVLTAIRLCYCRVLELHYCTLLSSLLLCKAVAWVW